MEEYKKVTISFTKDDDLDDEDEDEYFGLSMRTARLAPCFAVFRPVCDLLEIGEKVSVRSVHAVFERLSRFLDSPPL